MVERYINAESQKQKNNYYNLCYVIKFEQIFESLTNAIQKTSEAQLNFWLHLQNPNLIDFNALDKDNGLIYNYVKETRNLWKSLCAINSNYVESNNLYAEYLREIRNDDHLANQLQDNVSNDSGKKVLSVFAKNNEILFTDNTGIVHISSAKDSLGKVLEINAGVQYLFGYNPAELLQTSINKIIPNILSRKHNDFMERYFRTGRSRILNKERPLFGLHKKGYCFPIKLLVRIMPELNDGFLQFAGMILSNQDDYEYIITDTKGTIDSISKNLALKFKVKPKVFHKLGSVNVQLIAPELIYTYHDEWKKTGKGQKFKEPGGEELYLIFPTVISEMFEKASKNLSKKQIRNYEKPAEQLYTNIFGKNGTDETTPGRIFRRDEYSGSTFKLKVKCEVQDMFFGLTKERSDLTIRILKISGIKLKQDEAVNIIPDFLREDEENKVLMNEPEVKVIGTEQKSEIRKKTDAEPNDIDEEVIVDGKKTAQRSLVMQESSVAQGEPLDSFRCLVDKMLANPPKQNNEDELADANTPRYRRLIHRLIANTVIKEDMHDKNTLDGDQNDFRNDSMEAEKSSYTLGKKSKIFEVYEIDGKPQCFAEPYKETPQELEVRKDFIRFQLKEKKHREKMSMEFSSTGENDSEEEKNEGKVEEKGDQKIKQKVEQNAEGKAEINAGKADTEFDDDADGEEGKIKREDDDEGSVSSTSTGATIRSNYSIRAAIEEKFIPQSINNTNYMTMFMFVLLLGLAIAYYASEVSLYKDINKNTQNIQYSEDRKNALIQVDLNLKVLLIIDSRFSESVYSMYSLGHNSNDDKTLILDANTAIGIGAQNLKGAQTQLSLKTSNIGSSKLEKINPSNVNVSYLDTASDMPNYYVYSVWQAMLEVVVASLYLSNQDYNQSVGNFSAVYLINTNSLNSILMSLDNSTSQLIEIIEDAKSYNMTIYLILLIIASVAIAISMIALIPVLKSVKRTKEEVLSFFLILEEAEIKMYQKRCEKFAFMYKKV